MIYTFIDEKTNRSIIVDFSKISNVRKIMSDSIAFNYKSKECKLLQHRDGFVFKSAPFNNQRNERYFSNDEELKVNIEWLRESAPIRG